MRKIYSLICFAILTIFIISCTDTNDVETNEFASSEIYELDSLSLNGWDFGYGISEGYIVARVNEDNSVITMLNKKGGSADQGVIVCMNEDNVVTAFGTINKIYSVKHTDSSIVLYRFDEEGLYEETIISKTEKIAGNIHSRSANLTVFIKPIDFLGNISTGITLVTDIVNWDWLSLLEDASYAMIGIGVSMINPLLGTTLTVGFFIIDSSLKQHYEHQRNILYSQCEIQIDEIKNENGICTVYTTVSNANTLMDYLTNMYEPVVDETTRNLVYCGIVVRKNNGCVTTHLNDYTSQAVLINEDEDWGAYAHLAFEVPDISLDKSHDVLYFRPYLKSTRIKSSEGDVNEGYIKYGNTVPYHCFTGKIIDFNQYSSDYYNGSVNFKTTVHTSIDSVEELKEWGVYVYNVENGTYDYYPSEFKSAKIEDYIDIDFTVSKDEFDEFDSSGYFASKNIQIGVYKKIENPTGLYDHLSYMYSEKETFQLIYDQKPSIVFTSASVDNTEILAQDEHGKAYQSSFNYTYTIKGSLWFDSIELEVSDNMQERLGDIIKYKNSDGTYSHGFTTKYEDYMNMFTVSLVGYLSAGGRYDSETSLLYEGSPINKVTILYEMEVE